MRMDIAICILDEDKEKKPYIFYAPEYTITDGDDVIVITSRGKKLAKVVQHISGVEEDDTEVKIIRLLTGVNEPFKRVLSKVRYLDLEY